MPILPGVEIKDIDMVDVEDVKGGTPFWFFKQIQGLQGNGDEEKALEKLLDVADPQAITYTLEISALSKTLAKQKARAFVRRTHPFEPSLLKFVKLREKGMGQKRFRNQYVVEIYIEV